MLIGTISVETSEMLSAELKRRGIEHVVLNAKPEHAEREGETIAAGGPQGRSHDRDQHGGPRGGHQARRQPRADGEARAAQAGGQARRRELRRGARGARAELETQTEAEADEVRELGGLYILGTERHESRRIDNQLRGRSGRQGDPGESRFFLSAEDDLIRLFAGERIYKILDRLGPVDEEGNEEALEAKMLTKTIEGAQKKVEQQNFLIRKRVLEYDDVMNEQRRVIYRYRREVLEGKDMSETAREELVEVVSRMVDVYTPGDIFEDWDLGELRPRSSSSGRRRSRSRPRARDDQPRGPIEMLAADALAAYDRREQEFGEELMRELERAILLQIIDNRWREHLHEMDYLREGIHLRGFAQIDPLVAYKNEGFSMFEALMDAIWEEFARLIFHVEVEVAPAEAQGLAPERRPDVQLLGRHRRAALGARPGRGGDGARRRRRRRAGASRARRSGGQRRRLDQEQETVVKDEQEKIGRNDPCWCGSGKKYKKCHGA